jgi:fructokinase
MVVTFGEALVDMIEQDDGRFAAILGGSVCNFTIAVARQGLPTHYLNPLSADSFGLRFDRQLAGAGVHRLTTTASPKPTSLAVVTLDANKVPTYAFHRAAVADRDILPEQAVALLPAGMALFQTGCLMLVPDDLASTLQVMRAAAAAGAVVSVDANMRPKVCPDLAAYAAGVRTALAEAHLVKVSEEDLLHLGYSETDPVAAAQHLFEAPSVQLVALTLGDQGALLLTRHGRIGFGTPANVAVVDTVGAGDCFLAGLVVSLREAGKLTLGGLADLDAATLEQALRRAIATATLNVMRQGCNPPSASEVDAFLASDAARLPPIA